MDNIDADILAGNWMAAVQQSRRYYFHADGLGSVVALSDRDGRTVEVYRYDVLGRTAIYDYWVDLRLRAHIVSIHAPVMGATRIQGFGCMGLVFQSTPP